MLSRDFLVSAIRRESDICQHLAGKITGDDYDFRLTPSGRSTIDLMQYLAFCAIGPVRSYLAEDWKEWFALEKERATMGPEEFADAMDSQATEFAEKVGAISEEELRTRIVELPGIGMMPLGTAIVETSYIWLLAYRHELFLRVKLTSAPEVDQVNNWIGKDRGEL